MASTTEPESASTGIQASPSDDKIPTSHPPALYFFFWGEFAERASYYGMRAILPLYLTAVLHFSDTQGGRIYYCFKMACYLLPLLGGYLADRFFGRYWTIVGFSIPYVLGHFVLGIENNMAMFMALALLAGGSGVIKPNISTLMGQTYDAKRPGQERLRSAAFMWFYLSINVGAVISQFAMPEIRDRWGASVAFQFPAWVMVLAFAFFASGKRFYAPDPVVHELTPEERAERWRVIGRLLGIFGLIVFFWVPYEYNDSYWVFFARDYVNREVPWRDTPIPPDQIQLLNPLFVVILVPVFNWLFKRIDPQMKTFRPTRKILAGFALTAVAAGLMSAAGFLAVSSDQKISLLWPSAAYIVLTAGEVLLYGTGLELAYAAAPKSMKGFVTACFLVTNTVANLINAFGLAWLYGGSLTDKPEERGPLSPGQFFGMTALIAVAATIAFVFVGRRFDRANENRAVQAV